MKIIDINSAVTKGQLLKFLQEKLNPLFQKQKQTDLQFTIESKGDTIEISQPDLYAGFLFQIEINGTQLLITRSEHYVDDINSLTLESILNGLFEELSGNNGVKLVLEG